VVDILAGETDLDREIGGKLNREHLEKAFAELPERQRQMLEMFYFEGLDLYEIGRRTERATAECPPSLLPRSRKAGAWTRSSFA